MADLAVDALSPHRQHKRDKMVARILDTARAIMREEGVAALSMQELARRLDLRASSLYNYFNGKMDLYDALFQLGFTRFNAVMARALQDHADWQDELRSVLEAYMTFARENPDLYQLCFERPVPGFVPSEKSLAISFGALEETYAHARALLPHLNTDLNERQLADLVIAISHGLTALHMANEPELPVGAGRFGSLIPAAVQVLGKAWS